MSLEMNSLSGLPGDSAFRRDELKGTRWEPTYAGALSFMRRKYTRDLTGVDIAVTGIPFDQAVSHRSGTRMGPEGIRKASAENAWGPSGPGTSIPSTRSPSPITATASSTGAARKTSRSASKTTPPKSSPPAPR